ncbi:MAG TPA: tRNA epoxyqueuosine(34) reductase QueG [Candidatus Paceibacterota bacterium]|nr:tRNA epoxyqueuosine(34) reductase QueG [Verrucomicrobiota bacterium]HRZ45352.1 tRNA epoxyqueuosine(34) reductase QueG [Candidatus Paceibacterota bacterium]
MKEALRQQALERGFSDCRFAPASPPIHAAECRSWILRGWHGQMGYLERQLEKRFDPQRVLAGARTLVVLSAAYSHAADRPARESRGVIARYARGADYHQVLAGPLAALAGWLEEKGGPGIRCRWFVDAGPLVERDHAERAGLGFVGKHTNLISRADGNWIFLAGILTTLDLEPDPPERNRCGSCRRCIDACPTRAIAAPFQLDARRCISYLTIECKGSIPVEWRPAIGARIFGCDDCLAACPWNRFARGAPLLAPHGRPDLAEPDLLELAALDDAGFRTKFEGTPIARIRRRRLLRNVCVALGNTGGDRARAALERLTRDPEPLVGEHAEWALSRIRSASSS